MPASIFDAKFDPLPHAAASHLTALFDNPERHTPLDALGRHRRMRFDSNTRAGVRLSHGWKRTGRDLRLSTVRFRITDRRRGSLGFLGCGETLGDDGFGSGSRGRRIAAGDLGEYTQEVMPTNGKKPATRKKTPTSKPTAAQQRARSEYVRRTGHKVSRERAEQIRSQWQG